MLYLGNSYSKSVCLSASHTAIVSVWIQCTFSTIKLPLTGGSKTLDSEEIMSHYRMSKVLNVSTLASALGMGGCDKLMIVTIYTAMQCVRIRILRFFSDFKKT